MYNTATPFHIATEVLFWCCFFVLSKAKVRTSFSTSLFYTNWSKSQIGTLMDLTGMETFLSDITSQRLDYIGSVQETEPVLSCVSVKREFIAVILRPKRPLLKTLLLLVSTLWQSTVLKKMAAVHFTTVPCEPN